MQWIREYWSSVRGNFRWDLLKWLWKNRWAFFLSPMITAYNYFRGLYLGLPPSRALLVETFALTFLAVGVLLIILAYSIPNPVSLRRRMGELTERGNKIMVVLMTGKHRAIADFEIWEEELTKFAQSSLPTAVRSKFNSYNAVIAESPIQSEYDFCMSIPGFILASQPEVKAAIDKLHFALLRIEAAQSEM